MPNNNNYYFEKKYGINTKRRAFQNEETYLEIPNLLEIQEKSFQEFLDQGIDEVFRDVYPIVSNKGDIKIEYLGHKLKKPKNIEKEIQLAREKGGNYTMPLVATLKLTNGRTGEVKTSDVHFSDLPMMIEGGSFIINGSERVIISQIIRSPGVYLEEMKAAGSQSGSDDSIFNIANIVPNRGSWIEFDYKDFKLVKTQPGVIKVKIDKSKRLHASILFYALGLSDETMYKLFSKHPLIINTITKLKSHLTNPYEARKELFKILHPGDRITKKGVNDILWSQLFNKKRYNLSKTGRFKMNSKLSVVSRIYNKTIAEDICDTKGNPIFKKNTLMTYEKVKKLEEYVLKGNVKLVKLNEISNEIFEQDKALGNKPKFSIHLVYVYASDNWKDEKDPLIIPVVGNDPKTKEHHLTIPDIIATFSFFINLEYKLDKYDDIDALSNRRIRTTSELLQNQIRIGMTRIEKHTRERISARDISTITVKNVTNNKLLKAALRDFFNSSQLSQFMDQVNPLAEISNKRRITALGPGGLSRDTASLVVRGIHDTHYGRICPIETPEGPNIGLILNLALYARVDEYGFIRTPYAKVVNGKVTNEIDYMISSDEDRAFIVQRNIKMKDGKILDKEVIARHRGRFERISFENITHIDISPRQIVSLATSCIPFLENDDANRALMGANMQRQAIPLLKAETPLVATGSEEEIARYIPTTVKAKDNGIIKYVDGNRIEIKYKKLNKETTINLSKFVRSNQTTIINQIPRVKIGQKVKKGDFLADGPSVDHGELALGKNVLVAFTTWRGYNYEDAIAISSRLVEDDVYTSVHIEEYTIDCRKTKIGLEEITVEVPNASRFTKRNLDSTGIITIGSQVIPGDILVGKITPKGDDESSTIEKILDTLLGDKIRNMRDTSLRVPNGGEGIVHDVKILDKASGDDLEDGVIQRIKIFVIQKRKIKEGDKMAGRHGNKGVISVVLPKEDMPFLEDGTSIDIMLNPLGVPSRMNIGQILELHLGMAAKKLNIKVSVPPFDGNKKEALDKTMKEAGLPPSGKLKLFDGISGEKFDNEVTVGYMYMLKLSHMVDDKMHSRSVGPYSLITQQPLGGKSQNGGQRFGEMEAWALEGYGASNLLQEMFTLKSDDIRGRNDLYNSLANGRRLPDPNIPEAFWVLNYELRGLGMSLKFLDEKNKVIELDKKGKLIKD